MRRAFAETLADLAEQDQRIVLLTGDLGFMALDAFIERHPARFFNAGVAEQNMIGVATGLAEAGFRPYCYSIIPFALLRGLEMIRNGPVMHGLPVRIVGVGAGFDYGSNGFTHYGVEDLAIARALPGLSVYAPADSEQARCLLAATSDLPGPAYYRLGRDEQAVIPGLDGRFECGRVQLCADGGDVLIVAASSIAAEAANAVQSLGAKGHQAAFAVVAQIAPAPRQQLLDLLRRYRLVVSVENHILEGGLGSMLAEIIAEEGLSCRLRRCGLRLKLDGRSGPTASLNRRHGISAAAIAETVETALAAIS